MTQRFLGKITRRAFGRLAWVAPIAGAAAAAPVQERRAETAAVQERPAAPDPIDTFNVPVETEPGFVYRP